MSEDHVTKDTQQPCVSETNDAVFNVTYESLKALIQKRLDRFRKNSPQFELEYEGYEIHCCRMAMVIALYIKAQILKKIEQEHLNEKELAIRITQESKEAISAFMQLPDETQETIVYEMRNASGHSFATACRLAEYMLSENPERFVEAHAAMARLAGCKACGCHDQ
ncbi:MAG: hypothetical protein ACD_48C00425G0002 [uncultured bacterium]|nr:MAG: hypothetical protein ACD_48C00425G0002 [uncultured bacterium]